ncbi:hypothetical protein BHM03_00060830 [Ensete ventricosum]|nr:hypothetical protein BHM03_00060830 [Ensete ventricosum]
MVIYFAQSRTQNRVSIDFSCTISEIQNFGHSRRNSPWEVVQARYRESHKLCVQSHAEVEFRSVFRATSQKFKILAIPDILAHGKSYEHDFAKKLNGHILCANRALSRVSIGFSCTVPKIQNIGHSRRISP